MSGTGTGSSLGAPDKFAFKLINDEGVPTQLSDFSGRYPLVFFGFTHCKVVCPRALTRLSGVITQLGAQAQWLAPLYISVDPDRDTPEVMRSFLQKSYPRFTGLTGDKASIDAARAAFRVFAARRADPDNPEGYDMPHSAITYLLGPDGRLITHFPDSVEGDKVVERLRALLPAGTS
jgi:protein SCO1